MNTVRQIIVYFPTSVELPEGFEQTLNALIGMVTKKYEKANPTRTMWPAGSGSMPNRDYTEFDDSVYVIEVAEREAHERELQRRKQQREVDESEQSSDVN